MEYIEKILPFVFLVFMIQILIKTFVLKRKGIKTGSGKTRNKNAVYIYFVFVILFLLFLLEICRPAFSINFYILPRIMVLPLIQTKILSFFGLFFILFSQVILLITLIHFKNSLRFGLESENQGELITKGIFSITRNPFFISVEIFFVGNMLVIPNPFFIVLTLAAITSIHWFVLKEEKFLLKTYGKKYNDYKRKVRRYL